MAGNFLIIWETISFLMNFLWKNVLSKENICVM